MNRPPIVPSCCASAQAVLALLMVGACTYDFEAPFAQSPTSGVGGDGAGGIGGVGGAGGEAGGPGGSVCDNPPASPAGPRPADGATDVDSSGTTGVDWDDVTGAVSYEVYLSEACPPPGYPNDAFQTVAASELTGQSLTAGVSYCWQVVAVGQEDGCFSPGPPWTFQTAGVCTDPEPGPPTVTSVDAIYASGTSSDTYTLAFSEGVTGVGGQVTWTPVVGNGVMGSITPVDGATYTVAFSGVSDSDRYTLTVGTGVTDVCGNPLVGPEDIDILIRNDGGDSCQQPADLYSETYYVGSGNHDCWAFPADPQNDNDQHSWDCDSGTGGDMVVAYVTGPSQTTLHFEATLSNYVSTGYLALEIVEGGCTNGQSLHCVSNGPGSVTDSGAIPVSPSTTYWVWVADGFNGHPLPDIDLCLW